MKIFIIGGPCSGKTYAGKKISHLTNTPHYQSDEFLFDKSDIDFTKRTPDKEVEKITQKILNKKSWIIESASAWDSLMPFINQSDKIFILNSNVFSRAFRIIKRYFLIRNKIIQGKDTNLKTLKKFLNWNLLYDIKVLPHVKKKLNPYKNKTQIFSKADKLIKLFK